MLKIDHGISGTTSDGPNKTISTVMLHDVEEVPDYVTAIGEGEPPKKQVVSNGRQVDASKVVELIEDHKAVYTITLLGDGGFTADSKVGIYNLDGEKYIRANPNESIDDNLESPKTSENKNASNESGA